jgi:hypothetical protein
MHGGEHISVAARRSLKGIRAVAAAVALLAASSAGAQTLFDWGADPLTGPATPANFTPAPFLKETPNNAAAVSSYLAGQPIKAVKVYQPLSPLTVSTVYGANNVKYTFADYEGAAAMANTTALANQIRTSAGTGPAVIANQSFVGNYGLAPIFSDPTRPAGNPGFTAADYTASGVNMANESLYPGKSDFRNPVAGNSTAPNIRSALFTLPITRASIVSAGLPAGHAHIPYVTRFNNWNNPAFANGVSPVNGQPAFYFDQPHGTADQLLSRGDYSAMIAHYRARNVTGVHELDGGVVGYSQDQFASDTSAGWHFAPFESIINGGGSKAATLDTNIRTDGQMKSLEDAGMAFSGVYSLTQNAGAGKLALLVSNLDEASHSFSILNKIGGKTVPGSITVNAGQHKLLEFTGAGSQWALTNPGGTAVFVDNNRSGVGVPEPTMIGGLGLAVAFGLSRRRRVTV